MLIEFFLARSEGPEVRFGPEAHDCLMRYDFPGNVRELEHLVARSRLLAAGALVLPSDLPEALRTGGGARAQAAPEIDSRLYERIVQGGESFWQVVQEPYLRREVSRDEVRRLIARAYDEAG